MPASTSDERAVRESFDRQAAAIGANDVKALLSDLAPRAVAFHALPPLSRLDSGTTFAG